MKRLAISKKPTITVKGTNLITQSDTSGNFSVFVPDGKKTITISSVGYIPQGKIDDDDRTFIGNLNPDFEYGLNISFGYKNFDFSGFFFGSHGNDIFNNLFYFTDFPDFFKGAIRTEAAVNSWTPSNRNAKVPVLRTTGGFSTDASGYGNSYFISKGSYFRAKQMQIGYTLPGRLLSKYGIERLRIYVQAVNLFTITKYEGLDPELQSQPNLSGQIVSTFELGIDQGNYPHTPAYLIGINLNF